MKKHAIVIGGSVAGLCAAKVLTQHFEQVTILERDVYPQDADFRKGTPQARHPHILLNRGQLIMEELFPGFTQQVIEQGAVPVNFGQNMKWNMNGQWRPTFDSSVNTVACSRIVLEGTLRRYLIEHPQISFIQEAEVTGLLTDTDKKQVQGVQIRLRGDNNRTVTLDAEMVVDTSGRESRAPEWLQTLGYDAPQETTVDSKTAYTTRIFACPPNYTGPATMYVQHGAPYQKRGGVFVMMEGNRLHLSLVGVMGEAAPTDEEGFMDFARSLPAPELYEIIKDMEPLSDIYGYRRAATRLRHYDMLERYLENFVLLGDSVLAFNPIYGQGMTVAAMSAYELKACLAEQGEDLTGLAETFQKRLMGVITPAWQLNASEDGKWFPADENQPLDQEARLMMKYMDKVMEAASINPVITDAVYRVMNMVEAPTIFFRPDIVLQVMDAVTATANV